MLPQIITSPTVTPNRATRWHAVFYALAFFMLATVQNLLAITTGDHVEVKTGPEGETYVNVRIGAASTETTPATQPVGAKGVVLEPTQSKYLGATLYEWAHVDFTTGADGWCIVPRLKLSIPATPTNLSPGTISSPGPVQSSNTVTLSWGAVTDATSYALVC